MEGKFGGETMEFKDYFPIWNKLTASGRERIEDLAELRKFPKGTVLHQILVSALKAHGLSAKDVKFVQMGIPKGVAAMKNGSVDAALVAANFLINCQNEGDTVLATAKGYAVPKLMMTASERFIKEHPDRLAAVLAAAGTDFAHVVKTTCFLSDISNFAAFNEIYAKYFTENPARSCVAVRDLPKGALVEGELIAELLIPTVTAPKRVRFQTVKKVGPNAIICQFALHPKPPLCKGWRSAQRINNNNDCRWQSYHNV